MSCSRQLVPGEDRYELVLTTRESPPDAALVEALSDALGPLISREDSPISESDGEVRGATWRYYPPLGERERELFAGLDWAHAIVVHEWVD